MNRMCAGFAGAVWATFGLIGTATAAVPGYTLPDANLRAGPGADYPFIASVPPGRPAEIFGCVGGWGWCDIGVDGLRGWVSGQKLQILYGERRVNLETYAPRVVVPVIGFDLGSYWGRYYPDRPFFAQRDRWVRERQPDMRFGGPPHRSETQASPRPGAPEPRPPAPLPPHLPVHPMPEPGGPGPGPTHPAQRPNGQAVPRPDGQPPASRDHAEPKRPGTEPPP